VGLTLRLYISASVDTTRERPFFFACASALGFSCSKLFHQRVVHTHQLSRMLRQRYDTGGRQLVFRWFVVAGWALFFVLIVAFLSDKRLSDENWNILATAFVAANIVWVVGWELTVQSKRSGKFLFRTYV
jgi:hypothetical protein